MAALEIYILLEDAAKKYGLSAKVLTHAVEIGIIRAVRVNGGIAVAEEDVAVVAAQARAEKEGDELVSLNEAARRLGVRPSTVWQWYSNGWLPAQGRGSNRAILVSFHRAQALAGLWRKRGKRGRRLIPRGMEVSEALALL